MRRRNHYDVTNRVEVARPEAVAEAVATLLGEQYAGLDLAPVQRAFEVFGQLYAGSLRGYHGCETWYHDAQHSLDCALAFVRLLQGHERSVAADQQLGGRRAALGVISALFHDAGYIRKNEDTARHGAEFTFTHVGRSGDFLLDFLPTVGFAGEAAMASQLVHFTGYELALDHIRVPDAKDRLLGFMLGSADVMAQTADRCYLEKCRDFLFSEFEICGLAGPVKAGHSAPVYDSPTTLLLRTPEFSAKMWAERMDGYFQGVHQYMAAHFSGRDLYSESIQGHQDRLQQLIARDALNELRLKPRAVLADDLAASD